jgi:hypothetical protein
MLKRVRIFFVRLNFIIEQVDYQVVHLEYLNTLDHPADLCTKALLLRQFERLCGHMLGSQRVRSEVSASSDSMDVASGGAVAFVRRIICRTVHYQASNN